MADKKQIKLSEVSEPSIIDSDASSIYILGTIKSGEYQGGLINVREQGERLASMPNVRNAVISKSQEIEEKRKAVREKAHKDCVEPNFQGLAMPRVPMPVGKLANDPVHGVSYVALASAVGADTPIYHFLKRENSDVILGIGWRVMAGEVDGKESPVVVTFDDKIIPGGEFIGSQLGNGSHCYVRFGPIVLDLPIAQSKEMDDERKNKAFNKSVWDLDLEIGEPSLTIGSAVLDGELIPSMKAAPMEFIHPRKEELIPWHVPLKIEKVLTTTTRYEGVRIVVTDPEGTPFIGLLAVDGIRRICGQRKKTAAGGFANVLTENSIGKTFQIDGAKARVNSAGQPLNVANETEKQCSGEFVQCWDVLISDPSDSFEIDL